MKNVIRAGAAVALVCAAVSGCGRDRLIERTSLRFMSKDPDLHARRDKEARKLIGLGVFVKDMTVDQIKALLGSPTHVHRGPAGAAVDGAVGDLQYVYRLDGIISLRVDFVKGRLKRLRRQHDLPDTIDHGMKDIELQPAPESD